MSDCDMEEGSPLGDVTGGMPNLSLIEGKRRRRRDWVRVHVFIVIQYMRSPCTYIQGHERERKGQLH